MFLYQVVACGGNATWTISNGADSLTAAIGLIALYFVLPVKLRRLLSSFVLRAPSPVSIFSSSTPTFPGKIIG